MTTRNTLLLMRHAKSDWHAGAGDDFSRPLSARGRRDSPRIGQWLLANDILPARILCSAARRTRETAELLCAASGLDPQIIVSETELYLADPGTLLAAIGRHRRANPLMLLGHNPGMEDLLRHLASPAQIPHDRAKLMPTAALAWLEFTPGAAATAHGAATLRRLLRPRDLPDGTPGR